MADDPFAVQAGGDPFALVDPSAGEKAKAAKAVRCDTDSVGRETPGGLSPLEIVVDATEGFVPLWAKGTILRWRFRESSLTHFANPMAAKAAVEAMLAKAIHAWGHAAPIKFKKSDDLWDFEIVMQPQDNCSGGGCVLASAFFPDAGRHELEIYPLMLTQDATEQMETLAHEIGHVFGLRHFFALMSETTWPAQIFGKHDKFTIMNYGADSKLTAADKSDLTKLYQLAWSGQLTNVNGTPIRFVKPYHESGVAAADALLPIAAVVR